MNRLIKLCLLICVAATSVYAQKKDSCCAPTNSCCAPSATDQFAMFASDKDFRDTHLNPKPYTHVSDVGRMIKIATSGAEANAYELKSPTPSDKYLIVLHEWWGLNDHIKRESETYYNELKDVNVIAIDLYDGNLATTREDAQKFMQAADPARIKEILKGVFAYTGREAMITTIGWCFGGGWSLQAAILAGPNAMGCVMFYGMPEKDLETLKIIQTDVLGIFASREKWITPEVVKEFETSMTSVGKKVTIHQFDAEHGFANPSSPNYNNEASAKAYSLAIEYLKSKYQ